MKKRLSKYIQTEPKLNTEQTADVKHVSPDIGNTDVVGSAGISRLKLPDEYILCAAVHYFHEDSFEGSPINISSGYVVCGWRHHNCINIHFQLTNKPTRSDSRQGFLTNKNRFVGRNEAAEIAYESGQTKTLLKILYSEDVW